MSLTRSTGLPLRKVDQTAYVGTHLRNAAAGQFLFVAEAGGFSAEAGQRFLNDAVPRCKPKAMIRASRPFPWQYPFKGLWPIH